MGDAQQLLVPRRAMAGKCNSVEAKSASDVASKRCAGVSPCWFMHQVHCH